MLSSYLISLLIGLSVTLRVALLALGLGLIIGLAGALAELSQFNFLKRFFIVFQTMIRGVPELLVLFFVYFGSSEIINKLFHASVTVNSFFAGVIALGLLFGAYASQTFRGAFLMIPSGQVEAAKALGMKYWQTFWLILFPQALKHALPGLGNLWLVLLKDTALVSLIGLSDLMMRIQAAAVTTQKPFTFYFFAAVVYLILTSVSEIFMWYLNRRANHYI